MTNKNIKEPIRKIWIWVVFAIILLGIVPWYFPENAVEPIILGFPLWAFISLLFSLLLCAYLSWLCIYQWNIVEDEEEAAAKAEEDKR
ncbi:hypothetical protein [Sutcliffiella rhizosphaerae]|uniref:DUF3311 domain-containing protein n=1 Tax=Sutcliffiella rhizosphaerae TaxID=2880967 RepID=A0ABN8ACP6_9BACI|nr:hypothetical protein [Sutcliffiella rhizosphaerae]CAG9621217.1 hypothetical protein BACCIP111883_01989 [Sutcliffiella rhizosphaerae]